jgi:Ca2+-binding RTX toxin-like protein
VAYGDDRDDELRSFEQSVELHGGSGDDTLKGVGGEDDDLFGDGDDDTLTGDGFFGGGTDFFSCGTGIDTITDFNAAEGDTKTADCENF